MICARTELLGSPATRCEAMSSRMPGSGLGSLYCRTKSCIAPSTSSSRNFAAAVGSLLPVRRLRLPAGRCGLGPSAVAQECHLAQKVMILRMRWCHTSF